MSTKRQKEEARKRKLERRAQYNQKNSVQTAEIEIETEIKTEKNAETEKISVKNPVSGKDLDVGELLEQAGFNSNPKIEKFDIEQMTENLPRKENPRTENGITYFATNGGISLNLIFFAGVNYNTAEKKGKAIFNLNRKTWDLYVLEGESTLEKTKPGKHSRIAQIYFSEHGGIWKATAVKYKLQSAKELTFDTNPRYRDRIVKNEEDLFSGEINFVFQKSLEETKKRVISALRRS